MLSLEALIATLKRIPPHELLEAMTSHQQPKGCTIWAIGNELRPADLYCYLGARFGPPNGIQNLLRVDTSDNLIHWDWTLSCDYGWISFLGMNFRTEVQLIGSFPLADSDRAQLVAALRNDLPKYRQRMSEIKGYLEHWTEFANPYYRIRRAVDMLLKELDGLSLDPQTQTIEDFYLHTDPEQYKKKWEELAGRYTRGLGICFGIRSMIPVMAEAFVNLLLFALMKSELREDKRLRENAFRQHIDIRIKSLHLNCTGFAKPVDYSNDACKAYHSIVNERNDLLHGNVSIEKLKFNEVYFHGRVPIFKEYRSMWDRSVGVDIKSVGLDKVANEVAVVRRFIDYVLSCLEPKVTEEIQMMLDKRDLGHNEKTGGWGVLFPDRLVDMRFSDAPQSKDNA